MSWTEELFCNLRVNSPWGRLFKDILGNLLSDYTADTADTEDTKDTCSCVKLYCR